MKEFCMENPGWTFLMLLVLYWTITETVASICYAKKDIHIRALQKENHDLKFENLKACVLLERSCQLDEMATYEDDDVFLYGEHHADRCAIEHYSEVDNYLKAKKETKK